MSRIRVVFANDYASAKILDPNNEVLVSESPLLGEFVQAALWNYLFSPLMASCFGAMVPISFSYQSTTESGNLFLFLFVLLASKRYAVGMDYCAVRGEAARGRWLGRVSVWKRELTSEGRTVCWLAG